MLKTGESRFFYVHKRGFLCQVFLDEKNPAIVQGLILTDAIQRLLDLNPYRWN